MDVAEFGMSSCSQGMAIDRGLRQSPLIRHGWTLTDAKKGISLEEHQIILYLVLALAARAQNADPKDHRNR
jgi:hypothetical protein